MSLAERVERFNGRQEEDIEEKARLFKEETTALMAITKGEVDMQVSTAKRYPRSLDRSVKKAIMLATMDKETAESCFFALPRAGKLIEGPSIRLAEIIASSWGNMRCESRIIDVGDTNNHVTAQATAWDMENNTLVRIESKRRITDKNGRRYKDDMILMTQNAAISIALRNAIFRVVPRSFVDNIYRGARKVALGNAQTMQQRRTGAFNTFAKLGVTEERILAALEKESVNDIDVEDLSKLLGLLNAIKEESTTVEEAFPEVKETEPEKEPDPNADVPKHLGETKKIEVQDNTEPEPEENPDAEPPVTANDLISAAASSNVPKKEFDSILQAHDIKISDKRTQRNQKKMQAAFDTLMEYKAEESVTETQDDSAALASETE